MTPGAAGLDLRADLAAPLRIDTGRWALIPTGLAVAIPDGFEGQVRPRSGRAAREGLTVLNAPGTIDADYRGEVQVLLVNFGPEPVEIRPADRIAQLVVSPVLRVEWQEVDALPTSGRGDGGFGSTGGGGAQRDGARD
jgi:dUTP pyrophosphatase